MIPTAPPSAGLSDCVPGPLSGPPRSPGWEGHWGRHSDDVVVTVTKASKHERPRSSFPQGCFHSSPLAPSAGWLLAHPPDLNTCCSLSPSPRSPLAGSFLPFRALPKESLLREVLPDPTQSSPSTTLPCFLVLLVLIPGVHDLHSFWSASPHKVSMRRTPVPQQV